MPSDTKPEPTIVQKRALDVTPYLHGIWCSIEGSDPFVNTIVLRKWSDDGTHIWFMLDSHNFDSAEPDEFMDVVEITPSCSDDVLADVLKRDAKQMASKPVLAECPHCKGTGKTWQRPTENPFHD